MRYARRCIPLPVFGGWLLAILFSLLKIHTTPTTTATIRLGVCLEHGRFAPDSLLGEGHQEEGEVEAMVIKRQ